MINIALNTEYTFRRCFGHLKSLVSEADSAIGVADRNNTFAHQPLAKLCDEYGVKPLFGVRLMVIDQPLDPDNKAKTFGPTYAFIACNNDGLEELYSLVQLAHDNFYYHAFITLEDVEKISPNIIVIASIFNESTRIDFVGLNPSTPKPIINYARNIGMSFVAFNDNDYPTTEDEATYQLLAGQFADRKPHSQHILTSSEFLAFCGDQKAIDNAELIASHCNVTLPKSDLVKFNGPNDLRQQCERGFLTRGINPNDSEYRARLERELSLIENKGYDDYFLIVGELIQFAKKKMLVGPGRGSSGGSLVCYLTGIVEVDPIKFGLLFERFIDVFRFDLPDIDIDFPDDKRRIAINHLVKRYGRDNVRGIGAISTFKPKIAINEFASGLDILPYETEALKSGLIERFPGDERASMCLEDTFDTTEDGKEFIEQFPEMRVAQNIEGHAHHVTTHAAGIIVCNDSLTKYCGVDSRNDVIMMDGKQAESIGLLKIDALGLQTLTVLASVCDQIEMTYEDLYKLPLNDIKAFQVFNDMRLSGIFQFEGHALQNLCRQMGVSEFEDIVAITALARPGPLASGGAKQFVNRRNGNEEVTYISDHPAIIKHTEATQGIIVYQEQVMLISREFAGLDWKKVIRLRKAMGKTLGEEFFNTYQPEFIEAAIANNIEESEAIKVWTKLVTFGAYGFNRSHAVAYGWISYLTAWAKANHPLEFAIAKLNNSKTDDQAIRLLRDMTEIDGLKYCPVDPDKSGIDWRIEDGVLLGGLTNIKGIGKKKAKDVIEKRAFGSKPLTRGIAGKLMKSKTPFDILFPCRHWFGDYYKNPEKYGLEESPTLISDIDVEGIYIVIARLNKIEVKDLNSQYYLAKRDGSEVVGSSVFANLVIEDDTAEIKCGIGRFQFDQFGRELIETAKEGESWYLIRGELKGDWHRLNILQMVALGERE